MKEQRALQEQRWYGRVGFAVLTLSILFFQLVPRTTAPPEWIAPDVLLASTLVFLLRRPDYLPLLLVAGVFFFADVVLLRPPGLMTALMLIVSETLRSRASTFRKSGFGVEWLTAALAIIALTFCYRFVLAIVLSPLPPLSMSLLQMMATILIYPLVAGALVLLFRMRRPAQGEMDSHGRPL